VPAKVSIRSEALVVPSPMMLGMPLNGSDGLTLSGDRKSLVVKKGGWTWTFTPSPSGN
jgi:hypothetical protein